MSLVSGDFRFGDAKARDDMGGCCGKPVGCNNPSKGCVHKPEKADWQKKAAEQKAAERSPTGQKETE